MHTRQAYTANKYLLKPHLQSSDQYPKRHTMEIKNVAPYLQVASPSQADQNPNQKEKEPRKGRNKNLTPVASEEKFQSPQEAETGTKLEPQSQIVDTQSFLKLIAKPQRQKVSGGYPAKGSKKSITIDDKRNLNKTL